MFLSQARSIEFRSATSDYNREFLSNLTIYVHNGSISWEFDLRKTIGNDFTANIDFQIRLKDSKTFQTLFGYNFNVCSMVVSFKESMFKRLFKNLLKYSNFMQNCPIYEGHYYLHNYRLEANLIPSYLYPGDYRLIGRSYLHKTLKNRTIVDDYIGSVTVEVIIL